jgi:hypothetical protein
VRGWILDLYPGKPGEMVVWLKLENGEAVRLVDEWSPSIFIGTDNKSDFDVPLQTLRHDFLWTRMVRRRERVTDPTDSEVIEAKLKDAKKAQQVAGRMERLGPFGTFRLYNADIPPGQSYLYERDLFPLALCEVEQRGERLHWELKDDVWDYDYALPPLRKVKLEVEVARQGKLPTPTDRIESISLESDNGRVTVEGRSEADKILGLVKAVRDADPDFILTNDGDTFLFPYLIKRAEASGVAGRLILDRDGVPMTLPSKAGTSYFSYGRIHYKPSAMKLCGRIRGALRAEPDMPHAHPHVEQGQHRQGPLLSAVLSRLEDRPPGPMEAYPCGALQGQERAADGRPRGLHLRAQGGSPRERRGVGLLRPLSEHNVQEEHLGRDCKVCLLPRLGQPRP